MILNIKDVLESPDIRKDFEFDIFFKNSPFDDKNPLNKKILFKGYLENKHSLVSLYISTNFKHPFLCDRCLCDFEEEFSLSYNHIISKDNSYCSEDEKDVILCENNVIDLSDISISDLIMSSPFKVLCKKECKGLCFKCGIDLNYNCCSCNKKEIDPRLQILGQLLS